jgi:uncharacterized membrane protein
MMARTLVAMAVLWPLAQAATVVMSIDGSDRVMVAIVQIVGSRVCHQRPDRSFHTAGVRWPVCARCSGLYLGGAVGAWFGLAARVRRVVRATKITGILTAAALPTVVTWVAEWGAGLPLTNSVRAMAALPLGAVIAAAIVAVASASPKGNQVN